MKPELLPSMSLTLPVALVTLGVAFTLLAAITSLAIYSIRKNNEISEMKGPKLVLANGDYVMLQVAQEDYEYIKASNKAENAEAKPGSETYDIDLELNGQRLHILCGESNLPLLGNDKYLAIGQMTLKEKDGQDKMLISFNEKNKVTLHKDELSKLGLGTKENDARALSVTLLPSPKVEETKSAAQGEAKESGPNKS